MTPGEPVIGATNIRRDPARVEGAPHLILVNSLAATGEMWDGVVAGLDGEIDVIRYDQRDRGGPLGGRAFTLDDLVDDLFGVLDSSGVHEAHIAGVSLGGLLALAAATARPERVLTSTAMCCAARFNEQVWIERAAQVRAHGVLPLTDAVMDRWFTGAFQRENPTALAGFRAMFASTSVDGYAFASDVLAAADLLPALSGITTPTLVVRGEFDAANPLSDQQRIVEAVPHARFETVHGAAHLAPASHPREIAALLRAQILGS